MNNKGKSLFIAATTLFLFSCNILTQAVPFLLVSSSPEANGQGTASISRQTDDSFVVNFNPAHLGEM